MYVNIEEIDPVLPFNNYCYSKLYYLRRKFFLNIVFLASLCLSNVIDQVVKWKCYRSNGNVLTPSSHIFLMI